MTEKQILEKQIEDAKRKLEELEEKEKNSERIEAIKNLDEFTTEEKVKFFDSMYKSALEELDTTIGNDYHDDNCEHYAWETYIEILARNHTKFWKYWNNIDR